MNRHVVELIALGAIWGFSFIFLRIAVPAIGASSTTFLRLALAALLVGLIARWRGVNIPWRTHGKQLTVFAMLGTAVPFLLFGFASKTLPAGYMAVLNGTAALFSAVLAIVWLKQSFTPIKFLGLLIGLFGVSFLVGLAPVKLTPTAIASVVAGLLGALCYAYTGHLSARHFAGISPYAISAGSLLPAAVALAPLAAMNTPPAHAFAPNVAFAVLFLGVVTTGLAYVMYFRMLEALGAVGTSTVGFMIPVFALIWGRIFLGEPITQGNVIGGALVLLGVALVNGILRWPKWLIR